jgi:crotonobetainyl-CoA:carnitine CoA-transferase CaiB-like acyl-CoA transferase
MRDAGRMAEAPLSGVTVLDLSAGVPGPYCARLLGELGADVVKVEPPEGDLTRYLGPFAGDTPDPERSGLFLYLNTDKRGVTLDLCGDASRTAALHLIDGADVLVESFGPGGLERFGLDAGLLQRRNPGLVIVSLSPFGLTGPYRDRDADELTLLAMAGWLNQVGEVGRPPLKSAGRMVGMTIPGLYGAYAALAALRARRRSGHGQRIDIGAMEAILSASRYFETTYEYFGTVIQRMGASQIYPCADGYVSISPGTSGKWEMFYALIERPDLIEQPRAVRPGAGAELAAELDGLVREWVSDKTRMAAFHAAQELGIVSGPVMRIDEVPSLPPIEERGIFTTVDHPIAGSYRTPGRSFTMSGFPYRPPRPAPLLGESAAAPFPAREGGAVSAANREGSGLPLAGVRVLEVTTFMAGPLAAALLADLGAEVIKIEAIQRLDGWRAFFVDPAAPKPYETGCCYNTVNRNKRGITLNLGCEEGRALYKELVAISDVVIENFSPRMMPNLGLAYEDLARINPAIIVASITGFGSSGSWKNYVSIGTTAEVLSGLSSITGYEGGGPLKHGTWLSDPLASLNAAIGVLGALEHRDRTGRGQWVEVSQLEVTIHAMADAFMDWSLNGRVWGREGNADPRKTPHNTYPCAGDDQWIAIAVADDDQWCALARLLPVEDWAGKAEAWRREHRREIDAALAAWTATQDKHELAARLRSVGVTAAPVMTPVDLLHDPHLAARGYFETVERAHVGGHPYVGMVPKFEATPCHIRTPAPTVGQDNAYVFGEVLGLMPGALQVLEQRQVIGTEPLIGR